MTMDAFHVITWGLIGIINLCGERVSKFSYALMWIMLMCVLTFNYFGVS